MVPPPKTRRNYDKSGARASDPVRYCEVACVKTSSRQQVIGPDIATMHCLKQWAPLHGCLRLSLTAATFTYLGSRLSVPIFWTVRGDDLAL